MENKLYDVVIVGGSYAGLSAAMALGRSLRTVAVVDNGKPCNASTPHSHNFLTQDGNTPAGIAALARAQVAQYPSVEFIHDEVIGGSAAGHGFHVTLESGNTLRAKKLIFATGIRDTLPNIPGFSEAWGTSVIHCPYCHGYEFRGVRTGIVANGEGAMHYVLLLRQLAKDLTLFTQGKAAFTAEQPAKLDAHHVAVEETAIASLLHTRGVLHGVVLQDGRKLAFDALYFRPPFTQHCSMPAALGCALTEQGYWQIDAMQKTTVEGVYACGDNSSMMRSVANAVATGNMAGAAVNRELAHETF